MRSERPKPLHLLCGRPMILHVLDAMAEIDVRRVVVVVGHRGEWVTKTLVQHAPPTMEIEFVEQLTRTGTGDALAVGLTGLPDDDDDEVEDVVVLPGDTPLLRPQTLAALVRAHRAEDAGATLLTAVVENPLGYGRVVHGKDGDVTRVVEEADATEEEKAIDEVNTSIYCFRRSILAPTLRRLSPANAQGEYYLTDAVGGACSSAGYARALPGAARLHGGGRGQRPGPAGRGRGRAARPHQRALDAPRRHHVGPRAHLRRRRGAPGGGRLPAARASSCAATARSARGPRSGPTAMLTDTTVGDGRGGGRERLHPGHHRRRGAHRPLQRARARGRGGAPARRWRPHSVVAGPEG